MMKPKLKTSETGRAYGDLLQAANTMQAEARKFERAIAGAYSKRKRWEVFMQVQVEVGLCAAALLAYATEEDRGL
jgi:hypothetical protein